MQWLIFSFFELVEWMDDELFYLFDACFVKKVSGKVAFFIKKEKYTPQYISLIFKIPKIQHSSFVIEIWNFRIYLDLISPLPDTRVRTEAGLPE